jgi:hypothetical protein
LPEQDFWTVNSYSYPNPFVADTEARLSWETLLSFYDFTSYTKLKQYWSDPQGAARYVSPHSVESRKAAFEQFGLLYVVSGSDTITITPAGHQFREAAEAGRQQEFAWIGLTLLFRYPLRGARGRRRGRHQDSDLLLYWFLYAAMRELGDYFWWTEMERVLCQVFRRDEAEAAISKIMAMRAHSVKPEDLPLPVTDKHGKFYNSLNQVAVQAGLNHFTLGKTNDEEYYEPGQKERRHWILKQWIPVVELAFGGSATSLDCDAASRYIARMPKAPIFGDERQYFDYLGAKVATANTAQGTSLPQAPFEGGLVVVLTEGTHYERRSDLLIVGQLALLCSLGRGQRLVLSHDLEWSYIVLDKTRIGSNELGITIRRGRPISNSERFRPFLGGGDG